MEVFVAFISIQNLFAQKYHPIDIIKTFPDYKRCTRERKSLHMIYIKTRILPTFRFNNLYISVLSKFQPVLLNLFFLFPKVSFP